MDTKLLKKIHVILFIIANVAFGFFAGVWAASKILNFFRGGRVFIFNNPFIDFGLFVGIGGVLSILIMTGSFMLTSKVVKKIKTNGAGGGNESSLD